MANTLPILLLVAQLFGYTGADITCKDNNNKPVDWFIIYKLPESYSQSRHLKDGSPPHLYMDSNSPKFVMLKQNLNETTFSLPLTLNQTYANRGSQEVGYIMYNDEKPVEAGGKTSESYGHTKGVTVFDNMTGLWLLHSAPKFPPPTNASYMYPHNALYYGQHMLCVSLATAEDVSTVGQQLIYNEPWVYDSNLPTILEKAYPVMSKVIHGGVKPSKQSNIASFGTKMFRFKSFAKTRCFHHDLYSKLVAPNLGCDLYMETWQHYSYYVHNCSSVCQNNSSVFNVLAIRYEKFGVAFKNSKDHSKFGVCKTVPWVCIGDINRQTTQMKRGGGTVCFKHPKVHAEYMAFVGMFEPCVNGNADYNC